MAGGGVSPAWWSAGCRSAWVAAAPHSTPGQRLRRTNRLSPSLPRDQSGSRFRFGVQSDFATLGWALAWEARILPATLPRRGQDNNQAVDARELWEPDADRH